MKKVVYYARVSTEEEKQLNALENQIATLDGFIKDNKEWELIKGYVDEGKSGTGTKNRKDYNKLMKDLESDKFDIIVVKDQSRLNRNVLDYYLFIDKLVKNEKQLFFYTDNCFYKADDTLINGIKALLSAEYSRDISKKVNAGNRQKQKEGTIYCNNLIWGYDKDGKNGLIINEKEAAIIRNVFQWYGEGKGFRIIFQMLSNQNIKSRGGNDFSIATLKRIIRNEKYKGDLVSNKRHKDFDTKKVKKNDKSEWIIHKGVIPAIVSEELWDRCNDILDSKRAKCKDKSDEYYTGLFAGNKIYSRKIYCGECGRSYWHTHWGKYSSYQCQEYRKFGLRNEEVGRGCVNYSFRESVLNYIMKQIIFKVWENKDSNVNNALNILKQAVNEKEEEIDTKQIQITIDRLKNKKSKLIDMLSEDLITKKEYNLKKEETDNKINELEKILIENTFKSNDIEEKLKKINKMQDFLEKNITGIDSISNEMINLFLDKIIVKDKNELEVILNSNLHYEVKRNGFNEEFNIYQNVVDRGSN